MMSQEVFAALKEMGVPAPKARFAAERYHGVEAAINWVFGDGVTWTAEEERPPTYTAPEPPGVSVTHHEVMDEDPSPPPPSQNIRSPPPIPPRTNLPAPFQSNNPFRNLPPPPPAPALRMRDSSDDEDDPDLRKAMALSRAEMGSATPDEPAPEDVARQYRERSVRASGVPPPSPEGEEAEVRQAVFGPSEKDDKDGALAMVPTQAGKDSQAVNKEQDDLDRAIADSLMTASFHSASAVKDADNPVPTKRAEGAPLVLYSQSGNSTYAANYLQGLMAIPQFREAIGTSILTDTHADAQFYMNASNIQEILNRAEVDENSFLEVDQTLREIRDGYEPSQLPPSSPTLIFSEKIAEMSKRILNLAKISPGDKANASNDYWKYPSRLFATELDGEQPTTESTYVTLHRAHTRPQDICSALSEILWAPESPNSSIRVPADILQVRLAWNYGEPRELWKLEERIVLDRFMKENTSRYMQIRADQGLAQGNVRRARERIEKMEMYQGQNLLESIKTLIKHYETSPAVDDDFSKQMREETKKKLGETLAALEAQKAQWQEELAAQEVKAGNAIFETDEPSLNQHSYLLRAVLFYDGAVVAGSHLYVYVRSDEGIWWKIQDHETVQTPWETIGADKTGLYMDGGPYVLLYSRERPRPPEADNHSEEESMRETSPRAPTLSNESMDLDSSVPAPSAPPAADTRPEDVPDLINLSEDEPAADLENKEAEEQGKDVEMDQK